MEKPKLEQPAATSAIHKGPQGKVNRACFLAAPSGRYVTNSYANLGGAARHSLEPVFKVLQHFQLTSVM